MLFVGLLMLVARRRARSQTELSNAQTELNNAQTELKND